MGHDDAGMEHLRRGGGLCCTVPPKSVYGPAFYTETGMDRFVSPQPSSTRSFAPTRYFPPRGIGPEHEVELPLCLMHKLPCTHCPLSQPFVIPSALCDCASRWTRSANFNCAVFLELFRCL